MEARVGLIDLIHNKRYNSKNINYYLNPFKQLKARCFTQILNMS